MLNGYHWEYLGKRELTIPTLENERPIVFRSLKSSRMMISLPIKQV